MTRTSMRHRQKTSPNLEAARTGALLGFLLALLFLLVAAAKYLLLTLRGVAIADEPLLPMLPLYVLGFTVAGAVVALLAVPLMARRGGSYLLFIIGSLIVYMFIGVAMEGFFTSWSGEDWVLLIVLSIVFGGALRFMLGRTDSFFGG